MAKCPMIGITAGFEENEQRESIHVDYINAILATGAVPVILPITDSDDAISAILDTFDGFILSGGCDVDPLLYGHQQKSCCGAISPLRDRMEIKLVRKLSSRRDKPLLGICRGIQVMNVALGGDLYQDLSVESHGETIAHRQGQPACYPSHQVIVTMSSPLDVAVHADNLMVNSLHHQAIHKLAAELTSCGVAPDGIIEAVALEGHPFFLGVQWHPEKMWRTDDVSRLLFQSFFESCASCQ